MSGKWVFTTCSSELVLPYAIYSYAEKTVRKRAHWHTWLSGRGWQTFFIMYICTSMPDTRSEITNRSQNLLGNPRTQKSSQRISFGHRVTVVVVKRGSYYLHIYILTIIIPWSVLSDHAARRKRKKYIIQYFCHSLVPHGYIALFTIVFINSIRE